MAALEASLSRRGEAEAPARPRRASGGGGGGSSDEEDPAVAEAVRQGAPEAAHAAMWPSPAPLGVVGGRGGGG